MSGVVAGVGSLPKVLIVDDEKSIRLSLQAFVADAGYEVLVAEDAKQALELLAVEPFDVLVSDIVLPGLSGVDLLKQIKDVAPDVPVIMMTGNPTVETASESIRSGAADYLTKPVGKDAIVNAVNCAAEIKRVRDENKRLVEENRRYQENLEQLVEQRTADLNQTLEGTIRAMSNAVESRDPYTAGHEHRVAELAREIAQEMHLPDSFVKGVYYAGMVHDLGKISVPAEILCNPGKLCKEAMGLIKKHPFTGSSILNKIKFPWPLADIVAQHHERLDGTGYPRGLAGDDICKEAQILGVADVVEAMASHRPYRAALGIEVALEEIEGKRGILYAPDVVDACLRLFREKGYALSE